MLEEEATMLSLERILIDGTLLCVILGGLIMASLYFNPRLWLQDYPKPVQAKVPPLNGVEKRQQRLLMLPFLLVMLGIPLYSAYILRKETGADFLSVYLHVFTLAQLFNLFDAVVLDLLILTFMKPKFAVIPGAEGMEYLYHDWGMHLRNFLKGVVICTVISLPIAGLVMLL